MGQLQVCRLIQKRSILWVRYVRDTGDGIYWSFLIKQSIRIGKPIVNEYKKMWIMEQ
jgi:hypothetical protein